MYYLLMTVWALLVPFLAIIAYSLAASLAASPLKESIMSGGSVRWFSAGSAWYGTWTRLNFCLGGSTPNTAAVG